MEVKPDLSINLELSLDGRDYYQVDELDITEQETIVNAMELFLSRLQKINSKQQRLDIDSGNELYLRLKKTSAENYDEHLNKQKLRYESLTKKEKTVLCFMGKGHKQKQTSLVLQITYSTLRQHQKNIYRKMGFHNKVQLAVWCDKYLYQLFRIC